MRMPERITDDGDEEILQEQDGAEAEDVEECAEEDD